MIRVQRGVFNASLGRWRLSVGGTIDRLSGTVYIQPVLARRDDGTSNGRVLSYLAEKHPDLVKPGPDMNGPAREAARASFNAKRSDLFDVARAAGPAVCRAIAARLRSGVVVTNTVETRERKARAGLSTTPGLATEQLATALETARIHLER